MTLRFRPKLRETLQRNNAADRHYAAMYGKEPMAQAVIEPKREYHRSENRISEAQVNDIIREFSASRDDITLWRNTRGEAMTERGPMRYGVGPNGASDFIGYRQVIVTPDMVGKTLAVFIAVESKAPDADAPTSAQQRFIEHINKIGGIAIVARGRADLEQLDKL